MTKEVCRYGGLSNVVAEEDGAIVGNVVYFHDGTESYITRKDDGNEESLCYKVHSTYTDPAETPVSIKAESNLELQMLEGPKVKGVPIKHGFTVEALLVVCMQILKRFNNNPKFVPCEHNTSAIEGIEQALASLNERRLDRLNRDVLNSNEE